MNRRSRRSAVMMTVLLGACAGQPQPVVAPTGTDDPAPSKETNAPPTDPGSELALPSGMRVYYMVLLRRGAAWTADDTPQTRALGAGHMKHIGAIAEAGKLIVAGPFLGQTDDDDIAGIYIFDVPSLEATKALTEADPAVKAGRFEPEYLVWAAAAGLRTDYEKPLPLKAPSPPCEGQTDFDFWIGQWQVTNPKGTVVGRNEITKSQRGCVLVERWTSAKAGTGTSLNYVDPVTKEWVQLWVDGSGGVIRLRGKLEGTAMALSGDYIKPKGPRTLLRGRWTPNPDGTVRQHFEESVDSGKTWKTWFDGLYTRRN